MLGTSKLKCFSCEQRFNLSLKEPIFLICCGNTACRYCVISKMIRNPLNASRGLAKKGEFECSGCRSNTYSTHTEQAVQLYVNMFVKS